MALAPRGLWLASVTCAVALVAPTPLRAAAHYVAPTGSDADDGTSPERAWATVASAATKAIAGDVVYIKAGLYREPGVTVANSGTAEAPIVFQGYTNTPGDTPDARYRPGDMPDPAVLPVLQGEPGNETGISVHDKSHIQIRNLGLTGYTYGIFPQLSHHVVVENVVAVGFGGEGPSLGGGQGIWLRDCDRCAVRRCVVTDASMANVVVERTHNTVVEDCASYAVVFDPPLAATDYHMVIIDGHDNTVRRCTARNCHTDHPKIHPGHGIGIKDRAGQSGYAQPHSYGNRIIDCAVTGAGEYLFVSHEAHHNEFTNCTATGQWQTQARWNEGINIRDGAHDNVFRNCRVEGAWTGLALQDTVEGPEDADGEPIMQICSGNLLANCVFVDSNQCIELWSADNNSLTNCVFDGAETALLRFPMERKGQGNRCRNSIVVNVRGLYRQLDKIADDDVLFTYSDFFGNRFDMPAGEGNISADPLFANRAAKDYHLKSAEGRWDASASKWVRDDATSPCVDAGDPADDASAEPEPNGGQVNMGAYGGTSEASKSPTR